MVDLIGPYKIRREGHDNPLIIKASIIIDPATGWFEMVKYNDKKSDTISNLDPWCSKPISLYHDSSKLGYTVLLALHLTAFKFAGMGPRGLGRRDKYRGGRGGSLNGDSMAE